MGRPDARLPNTFILGAPRSGTTFVYGYLHGHPHVWMSERKEPWYFGTNGPTQWQGPGDGQPICDAEEYAGLFVGAGENHRVIGEGSTSYLASEVAVRRIKAERPDARFIVVLRQPVERAWSNYVLHVAEGRETARWFTKAIALEEERAARGWSPFWQYTGVSRYREQLERWFGAFPREAFLVLPFDDLATAPESTLAAVDDFLGLERGGYQVSHAYRFEGRVIRNRLLALLRAAGAASVARRLENIVPGSAFRRAYAAAVKLAYRKPALSPEVRRRLLPDFARDIRYVESVINRPMPGWW